MTSLKSKLKNNGTAIGCWLSTSSSDIAEAMASCGFDWLAVDMEHGTTTIDSIPAIFAATERGGVIPLVRLPCADPYLARSLLDAGAQGLIIPVVEDAAEFSSFLSHCLYPPAGRRGVGLARCNRWGDDFESYLNTFQPLIVPQIETCAGVAAAESIAALESVDALFLGPYDLSASLGTAGDFTTAEFAAAIETVRMACERHSKALGIHQVAPVLADLEGKLSQGYRFIAYGTDVIAMRHAFSGLRNLIRKD